MPYYIKKDHPDCKSGWMVIDADNAAFGCHQTKQGAIDQAIAISLSTDEPFMGERAAINELEPGDYVSWNVLDPKILAEIVMVEGELAVIEIYEFEDGVYKPTENMLIVNIFKLQAVPKPEFVVEPVEPLDAQMPMDEAASIRNADGDPIILSDIDGTLLNSGNRNQKVWDYIQSLDGALFILTGRPESQRSQTEQDLASANITYSRLIMNDGSTADSPAYKKAKAEELLQTYDIVAAIENDATTLRYFSELGIDAVSPTSLRWASAASAIVAKLEPQTESEPMATDIRDKWLDVAYSLKARLEGSVAEGRSTKHQELRVNHADFEIRETPAGMTFEGYAAVFNSDSQPLPFIERIAPGAFKRSLQGRNEVKLLWNHDSGEPLASVRGGTLRLVEDSRGLKVQATLANTTRGRDVAELIRSKVIDSMSFGFSVIKDAWSNDGNTRTLEAVRLFEVSIVSSPAYEGTAGTVSVRSVDTGIDADQLADALMRLESGEELDPTHASLITDVVSRLTKTEEVQQVEGDILALKKKKLDLLLKEANNAN